jgi:hypothetical protein
LMTWKAMIRSESNYLLSSGRLLRLCSPPRRSSSERTAEVFKQQIKTGHERRRRGQRTRSFTVNSCRLLHRDRPTSPR